MEGDMKQRAILLRRASQLATRILGPRLVQSLIVNVALGTGIAPQALADKFTRDMGLDPLDAAFRAVGIGNYDKRGELTGENWLIQNTLRDYVSVGTPVFIDIGANVGEYALKLRSSFSSATIYALEPNPETYKRLERNATGTGIRTIQAACGSVAGTRQLYTYESDLASEHATTRPEILREVHGTDNLASFEVPVLTLDTFCREHCIPHVDFLKLDVEGDELDVLLGASKLIEENRLTAIQFEFNEMNVFGRVFLRDFFELLRGFEFYRLLPVGLLPLGPYAVKHEIFQYQNLFAVARPIELS